MYYFIEIVCLFTFSSYSVSMKADESKLQLGIHDDGLQTTQQYLMPVTASASSENYESSSSKEHGRTFSIRNYKVTKATTKFERGTTKKNTESVTYPSNLRMGHTHFVSSSELETAISHFLNKWSKKLRTPTKNNEFPISLKKQVLHFINKWLPKLNSAGVIHTYEKKPIKESGDVSGKSREHDERNKLVLDNAAKISKNQNKDDSSLELDGTQQKLKRKKKIQKEIGIGYQDYDDKHKTNKNIVKETPGGYINGNYESNIWSGNNIVLGGVVNVSPKHPQQYHENPIEENQKILDDFKQYQNKHKYPIQNNEFSNNTKDPLGKGNTPKEPVLEQDNRPPDKNNVPKEPPVEYDESTNFPPQWEGLDLSQDGTELEHEDTNDDIDIQNKEYQIKQTLNKKKLQKDKGKKELKDKMEKLIVEEGQDHFEEDVQSPNPYRPWHGEDTQEDIKIDMPIHHFTQKVLNGALDFFDATKKKSTEFRWKSRIERLASIYKEKFNEDMRKPKLIIIRTRLDAKEAVFNIINTSQRILNELFNFTLVDMEREGLFGDVHGAIKKDIKREIDKQYEYACAHLDICKKSDDSFAKFLFDMLTLLKVRDNKLRRAVTCFSKAVSNRNFTETFDALNNERIKGIVKKFEEDDIKSQRFTLISIKYLVMNRKDPAAAVYKRDSKRNAKLSFVKILNAINSKVPANKKNIGIWNDMRSSLKGWNENEKVDPQEIMDNIVKYLHETIDSLDAETKVQVIRQNFKNIMT